MYKLTLSIDQGVASRAKRYAKKRGVSVSRIVEAYLEAVSDPSPATRDPPILRSMRGVLTDARPKDYQRHLVQKYR